MVQFLSINFFSWIFSIFVGFFKSSRFFVSLYIPAVLWKAKFKVVYYTQYSSYQHCFRVQLGTVLIREVLFGTRVCSSDTESYFTRWMYLLY